MLDIADNSTKGLLLKIKHYCMSNADISLRYRHAKRVIRAFGTPAFYEVSTRCNLFCEGCYFFENSANNGPPLDAKKDTAEWKQFFDTESKRGVTMAYFVGAEPALEPERLRLAKDKFPYNVVGANGTIKLDEDLPFRVTVSLWAGDDETDRRLRGGSAFRKALRLYKGDKRVIVLYTVTRWNMHQIDDVAKMCADNGLELTFNLYSPTHAFNQKLDLTNTNESLYFRESTQSDSPCFLPEDYPRLHDSLDAVMDNYSDTVIYSKTYNDWVTQTGPLYDLDKNGIAINCGSRIKGNFRYHKTDLKPAPIKCCTPDVDCKTCRMYSGGWSSKFIPSAEDLASQDAFEKWLDLIKTLGDIFLYPKIDMYQEEA